MSPKIGSGKTFSDDWPVHLPTGIKVNVDTSNSFFTDIPLYFTSISGNDLHWSTAGATSIYEATKKGFTVYVRWVDGAPLTPQTAKEHGWYINWAGIEFIRL